MQEIKSFFSYKLNKQMNIAVYIPDKFANINLPVLYFLHGRTGDESILKVLNINDVCNNLIKENLIKPLIVVCPDIENSRGINSSDFCYQIDGKHGVVHKGLYEDYLIDEVIPFIDCTYNTVSIKKCRFIGGISSGGYAALHNGLRHQELFCKIGAHMPAMDLSYADEDECYFEDENMWKKYDPFTIARKGQFKDIEIYLDAGNYDEGQFYVACEILYTILKNKNVNVLNNIFSGHHDINYIQSNLKKYLEFYSN